MTIDLDKIETLAKAATPGPWRGDRFDGTVKYDIVAGDYPNGAYTVICRGDNGNACDGGYGFTSAENEAYALAANPAAILALVAEVRRLREAETMILTYVQGLLSSNLERAGDATKSMTNYALDRVAKEKA